MHMNDCVRKIELHKDLEANQEELRGFEEQSAELQQRLESKPYFLTLPGDRRALSALGGRRG